jgi:hypothetical protein
MMQARQAAAANHGTGKPVVITAKEKEEAKHGAAR